MKKRLFYFLIIGIVFIVLFRSRNKTNPEDYLILSEREAPLGWTYMTIYKDSTFEFVTRGITRASVTTYPGKATIKQDSIFFKYKDSVPIVGKRAIIIKEHIVYIDLNFRPSLEIRLNNLKMD